MEQSKENNPNDNKKKSFIAKFFDRLDQKMAEKAKNSSCCKVGSANKKGGSCC